MLTDRSVHLAIPCLLATLAACSEPSSGGGTESADTDSTTSDGGATEGTAGDETEGADDTGGDEGPRLEGVADLHLHMFGEEAFGGGWFHGTVLGTGEQALGPCDGGEPGDHGKLRDELGPLLDQCEDLSLEELGQIAPLVQTIVGGGGPLVTEFIANIPGSTGDTGEHADRTGGWPDLDGWPRWDAIAHQQVWEEHLREAYDAGLRVEVISAVSFDWLCRALPDENVTRPDCNEMDDVLLQLQMANDFAAANDWVEIALTAADLRRIVEEDKLAFILSVEASHVMAEGDWEPQLDELYDLGVRTLQPVHQLDNRFGGAAPHNSIFHLFQYVESCHVDYDCALTSQEATLGFDVDEECRNVLGLSDEGKALVRAMFDRGMLVDAAHLSERSVADLYDISVEYDYYPFYISHGHFREMMAVGKDEEEKTTPAYVAGMLREVGGMFGLRTAHEETHGYEGSPVENSCHGSSRSFAQAYDFGRLGLKVPMGLGSDLNGFIQQTRPRFGPQACSASFPIEAQCQARDERDAGPPPLGTGFDEAGLGHIALLDDLLDDLDQLGTDTEPLRTSAHDFVTMWERAEGTREGPVESIDDLDASGVIELPAHIFREMEYPTECDDPYCPGGLVAGDECRFNDECESGTCEGAGDCGVPTGICQ